MRTITIMFALILTGSINIFSQSVIAEWQLTSNLSPSQVNASLNAWNMSWKPSSSAVAYSSSYGAGIGGWTSGAGLDSNYYYEVKICPESGYKLNIFSLQFSERRTASCIRKFKVLYSLHSDFRSPDTLCCDSFYVSNPSYQTTRNHSISNTNISDVDGDTIFIRFFGYYSASNSSSSKWYLKDIIINGNLSFSNANDMTSDVEQPYTRITSSVINSMATNPASAAKVLRFIIADKGTGDNKPTYVDRIKIINMNETSWTDKIGGAVLVDSSGTAVSAGSTVITDNDITIRVLNGSLVEAITQKRRSH